MFVSMNWIQEFVDLSGENIESLIKRFTLSTAEVEDIYHMGKDLIRTLKFWNFVQIFWIALVKTVNGWKLRLYPG